MDKKLDAPSVNVQRILVDAASRQKLDATPPNGPSFAEQAMAEIEARVAAQAKSLTEPQAYWLEQICKYGVLALEVPSEPGDFLYRQGLVRHAQPQNRTNLERMVGTDAGHACLKARQEVGSGGPTGSPAGASPPTSPLSKEYLTWRYRRKWWRWLKRRGV
jgi:hypothetical protein